MGKTNPEVFVAVTRDSVYFDPQMSPDLVAFLKGVRQTILLLSFLQSVFNIISRVSKMGFNFEHLLWTCLFM